MLNHAAPIAAVNRARAMPAAARPAMRAAVDRAAPRAAGLRLRLRGAAAAAALLGLTPAAQAGRELFTGKAGCARCHSGPMVGGTGRKAWVGTTSEEQYLVYDPAAGEVYLADTLGDHHPSIRTVLVR